MKKYLQLTNTEDSSKIISYIEKEGLEYKRFNSCFEEFIESTINSNIECCIKNNINNINDLNTNDIDILKENVLDETMGGTLEDYISDIIFNSIFYNIEVLFKRQNKGELKNVFKNCK